MELAAQQKERTTKETEEDLDSGVTEMIEEERDDENHSTDEFEHEEAIKSD